MIVYRKVSNKNVKVGDMFGNTTKGLVIKRMEHGRYQKWWEYEIIYPNDQVEQTDEGNRNLVDMLFSTDQEIRYLAHEILKQKGYGEEV